MSELPDRWINITFILIQSFADSWWVRKSFNIFLDSVYTYMLSIASDWGQSPIKTEQTESVIHNRKFEQFLQRTTNQTSNSNEKTGNEEETAISKN